MAGSLNRLVTVREYAEAVEQNILDVFQTERLVAASYGCRQGPHTLTFALRLVGAYDAQGRPVSVSDEHRRKAHKAVQHGH